MELAQRETAGAAPLGGVIITLRRLYSPRFDVDAAFATAIDAIARKERARAASAKPVRHVSRLPA